MPATVSAASASIFLSTSQRETTSTGATWIKRSRSALPYQPQPIKPNALGFAAREAGRVFSTDRERQSCGRGGLEKVATVHGGDSFEVRL